MADIVVKCQNCGNEITLSEFASPEFLKCGKCGEKVTVPERAPDKPVVERLKLAAQAKEEETPPPPIVLVGSHDPRKYLLKRFTRKRRKMAKTSHLFWPWVIFVLLTIALVVLRYYNGLLSEGNLNLLIKAGIIGIFFFHVVIIAYAFAEDAFHGVLCILIPGYSLYYLFIETDQFYLRAVVASLLLAFGIDTSAAIRDFAQETYVNINRWMQDTETFRKDKVMPK
jgi:hypothetical protein